MVEAKPIQYLRGNGPSTGDELPYKPTPQNRAQGVSRFRVSTSGSASGREVRGPPKAVYYLRDIHSPEDILREWVRVNRDFITLPETRGLPWFASQHNSDWADAARDVASDELDIHYPEESYDSYEKSHSREANPKYDLSDVDPDEV